MDEVTENPLGRRASAVLAALVLVLVVLAGCGTWRASVPSSAVPASTPSIALPSGQATTAEFDTPVAALHRLYATADALDADAKLSPKKLDAVSSGSARATLAAAVRQRRADGAALGSEPTELTQVVARPAVRSGNKVTAVVQFCSSRQIEAEPDAQRQTIQPTTITFRYQSGRWRADTFGFDSPDCGCSQPIQCG